MARDLEKFVHALRMISEKPCTAEEVSIQVESKRDTVWKWFALLGKNGMATVCGKAERRKGQPGPTPYLWKATKP